MPNDYFNTQIGNTTEVDKGGGRKPLPSGNPDESMPVRTAAWPSLPGKAGPDRSGGVPEEKVYVFAQGLRGGKEVNDGEG